MSRAVKQPVGQKRLTNIAVVRLKKNGKRFEVACYRNKVSDWRAGIEKDLDEVLQTTAIFANVGKGVMAAKEDLQEAFGTTDETTICLEILSKGELQVSDKERAVQQDSLFKDIAGVIVDKTINPTTGRPYTLTMIERALRDAHFNPDARRSSKQQALEVLPVLQARFPIQRARMRLRLQVPACHVEQLLAFLDSAASDVESVDGVDAAAGTGAATLVVQVEPGVFRELHTFMQDVTARHGRIEVLAFAVTGAGSDPTSSDLAAQQQLGKPQEQQPLVPPQQRPQQQQQQQQRTAPQQQRSVASSNDSASCTGRVLYARGPVSSLPDEFESRRARFAELDELQPGWSVELRAKGEAVDAVFFSPSGAEVGPYAAARRAALAASKAAAAAAAAAGSAS